MYGRLRNYRLDVRKSLMEQDAQVRFQSSKDGYIRRRRDFLKHLRETPATKCQRCNGAILVINEELKCINCGRTTPNDPSLSPSP